MTRLARADFVSSFQKIPLRVRELNGARRLEGCDASRADLNRDGMISGAAEAGALWDGCISSSNAVETQQVSRGWLPFAKPTWVPTQEGKRLAALESFRQAEMRAGDARASGDRYLPTQLLPHGAAKGEPVDTTNARPAMLLGDQERLEACARAGVDPATIAHAFANMRHDGRWWTALVPKGALKDVFLMSESFPAPVPASHSMLRFALHADKPVVLVPQGAGEAVKLRDLVFSSEAIGQPGWKYDLVAGQFNDFAMVDRFESLEDRYHHVESYSPKHPVEQTRLTLGQQQKDAVLAEALRTSNDSGMRRTYSTLWNSCNTEAFAVLDRALGNRVPPQVRVARWATGEELPTLAPWYLRIRGLIPDGGKAPMLADEMATRAAGGIVP